MTALSDSSEVTRETSIHYHGIPLVVTLKTHTVAIRKKGTREAYYVPYDALFELGGKLAFRAEQAISKKGK